MSNHLISLEEAANLNSTYRSEKDNLLCEEYQGREILPICETFDRQEIDDLLAQDGCVSVRIYMGMDSNMKVRMVLVGVDENDEDILNGEESIILENGRRCPNYCPPSSQLNS